MFDGELYALIPHRLENGSDNVSEDFTKPRILRFTGECFHKNGEAYILFAKRGDAIPATGAIPFGVTVKKV